MAKCRIDAVGVLARDQLERKPVSELLVASSGFGRWRIVECLCPKLELARGGSEVPLGERQKRLIGRSEIEPYPLLSFQAFQCDVLKVGRPAVEQLADHLVFRLAETGVLEIHCLRERAKDIRIRARLTGHRQCRTS